MYEWIGYMVRFHFIVLISQISDQVDSVKEVFFQYNQEGTKILLVQVRCLQTNRRQRNRPSLRGGHTRGGLPKNLKVGDAPHHLWRGNYLPQP